MYWGSCGVTTVEEPRLPKPRKGAPGTLHTLLSGILDVPCFLQPARCVGSVLHLCESAGLGILLWS